MVSRILLLITASLLWLSLAAAGENILYLKDGTMIEVVRYEIKGNLVRYIDKVSKRWEEMPASLVDWSKTPRESKGNTGEQKNTLELKKGKGVSLGPSARERGYQITEGLYVPPKEGIYAFTRSQILPLSHTATILSQNQARKILNLATIPVFSNRSEVRLPGERSSIRLNSGPQTFYVRIDETEEVEVELLRLEARSGKRVVSRISQGALTGRASKKSETLELQKDLVEENLLRVSLDSLPPGEYAFWLRPAEVELKKGQVLAESGLWDFGID